MGTPLGYALLWYLHSNKVWIVSIHPSGLSREVDLGEFQTDSEAAVRLDKWAEQRHLTLTPIPCIFSDWREYIIERKDTDE